MRVRDLIQKLKELPEDAIVMDYSDGDGDQVEHVKYDPATETVWMTGELPLGRTETQMSSDRHLAAILAAWSKTDGYQIYPEMHDALRDAELDFDGVEADGT